jgi:transposase
MGGERCVDKTPHGHWGSMNGPTFLVYVEQCLVPALQPGDVVVTPGVDNLRSHKVAGVREAIEQAGYDLWYLPTYSPDLNPIEKLWNKVKVWLRRIGATTFQTVIAAVGDALRAVTDDECRHYFTSCGYENY